MANKKRSPLKTVIGLIAIAILFLGYSGNPPDGKTGAPDDGNCKQCHTQGNPNGFDGFFTIDNFPTFIIPGNTYSLSAKISNPNGLAIRGGFQAVVLNTSSGFTNTGDLVASDNSSSTSTDMGREYIEHSPAIFFPASNNIGWDFEWVAPNSSQVDLEDLITIYACSVMGDGEHVTGDKVLFFEGSGSVINCDMSISFQLEGSPCPGTCASTIDLVLTNGIPPFTFNWSHGAVTEDLSDLCDGTYTVTITDDAGCTIDETIDVFTGAPIISQVNSIGPTCNGLCDGFIEVIATNGAPPFEYDWNIDDYDGMAMLSDLCAGIYQLTITDANACSDEIIIDLSQSSTISISALITEACFGNCDAAVLFEVNGGNGTYTLTTDLPDFDICPGNYSVTVTDEIDCSSSLDFIVEESPEIMLNVVNVVDETGGQANGSIDVDVSGGIPPFNFEWFVNGTVFLTDEDLTDLSTGSYILHITDAIGCSFISSDIVVGNLNNTHEAYKNEGLSVFPNPAIEKLFIQMKVPVSGNARIDLFDRNGLAITTVLFSQKGVGNWEFDRGNLVNGVYWLSVRDAKTSWWQKIVLVK